MKGGSGEQGATSHAPTERAKASVCVSFNRRPQKDSTKRGHSPFPDRRVCGGPQQPCERRGAAIAAGPGEARERSVAERPFHFLTINVEAVRRRHTAGSTQVPRSCRDTGEASTHARPPTAPERAEEYLAPARTYFLIHGRLSTLPCSLWAVFTNKLSLAGACFPSPCTSMHTPRHALRFRLSFTACKERARASDCAGKAEARAGAGPTRPP